MKSLKNILLSVIAICLLNGCDSWLDVQPKTTIKYDKMFETETGFKDALIGCYLLMGDQSIYGRELTVTFLDVLAQEYEMDASNPYNSLASYYMYDGQSSRIDAIWNKAYRIIANLNAIIEMVEVNKNVLHPTNYANIKAEAYGLRAFLHFDLLRMFGWGDLAANPANANKLCIPYVTLFDKNTSKQLTVAEVLKNVHSDLKIAEDLLAYYGVYNQEIQKDDYELPNDDGFYDNRRSRFNYYAVKAIQARAYMWEGKYQDALDALDIFVSTTEKRPISWVDPDRALNVEEKERDLVFTTEHIFNLNITKMYEPLKEFVEDYEIKGEFTISRNLNYFYHSKERGELLYEIADGTGLSDYRYMRLYNKSNTATWICIKFYEAPEANIRNLMPIIKLPEMFYYAIECHNKLGNTKQAVKLLNEVRVSRGILYEKNLPENISYDDLNTELWKEWRKEYVGEGQLFYQYKRLNMAIPEASVAPGDDLFIFPLPETEVEIGGREDYEDDNDENI